MEFVNLTPHILNIHRADGSVMELASAGVARVSQKNIIETVVDGVEFYGAEFGDVVGLPAPECGKILIVSAMVKAAIRENVSKGLATRGDVVSPGEPVRDADGKIIGAKGLIA